MWVLKFVHIFFKQQLRACDRNNHHWKTECQEIAVAQVTCRCSYQIILHKYHNDAHQKGESQKMGYAILSLYKCPARIFGGVLGMFCWLEAVVLVLHVFLEQLRLVLVAVVLIGKIIRVGRSFSLEQRLAFLHAICLFTGSYGSDVAFKSIHLTILCYVYLKLTLRSLMGEHLL